MTRKHFEAIAEVMKQNQPEYGTAAYGPWYDTVSDLAYTFGEFNKNFDRLRFIEACMKG